MSKLEKLKELLSDEIETRNNYYTENEDNLYAEYCTWGFTEDEGFSFTGLDDEMKEACESIIEKYGKEDGNRKIADIADLSCESIYLIHNEIYSILIGETEDEIPEEAMKLIEELKLSDKDLNSLNLDAYFKEGYYYLDLNYSRWVLSISDISGLQEILKGE